MSSCAVESSDKSRTNFIVTLASDVTLLIIIFGGVMRQKNEGGLWRMLFHHVRVFSFLTGRMSIGRWLIVLINNIGRGLDRAGYCGANYACGISGFKSECAYEFGELHAFRPSKFETDTSLQMFQTPARTSNASHCSLYSLTDFLNLAQSSPCEFISSYLPACFLLTNHPDQSEPHEYTEVYNNTRNPSSGPLTCQT